ncbi:MAG: hypothetical protein DWQ07_21780 [Chloroflexi bacterium]|nr:MAG: hypothetical protein DWQ07_21780 [Chloroflexota bacterium]MBL1197318.1 hypothetical protein [Chloroflexota bacterium]NOH14614.1 hypothetical protein [Chloroflexota bacterium]
MTKTISQDIFTKELFDFLDETFETHHGIFLDQGTSLFDTLETISAAKASVPIGGKCASLAAQVAHVTFYLEVLERHMAGHEVGNVDWSKIWRIIKEVTPDEWMHIKQALKQTYQRVTAMLRDFESWNDEDRIGGALAIVVHTAYHLGEIRQALCTLE